MGNLYEHLGLPPNSKNNSIVPAAPGTINARQYSVNQFNVGDMQKNAGDPSFMKLPSLFPADSNNQHGKSIRSPAKFTPVQQVGVSGYGVDNLQS